MKIPTLIFAILPFMANPSAGDPNASYTFEISAGIASLRLSEFGTQSGMQLLYNFEDMNGADVAAIHGKYKPFDALDEMLRGTDIVYQSVNRRTITLSRAPYRAFDGWAYSCMPFDWASGFLLTKNQRLSYRIAVGLGLIAPDQEYCTPLRPLRAGEHALFTSETDMTIEAKKPSRTPTWGPRH